MLLILSALIVAAACCNSAEAQSAGKVYRIGHIAISADSVELSRQYLLPELARLGFTQGRNLEVLEATGDGDALKQGTTEMLAKRPDALIAIGATAARIAHTATRSIPIVIFADDPIGLGMAESLARPGGNVTGIANLVEELIGKRLDILLEAHPPARRVAALLRRQSPNRAGSERELRKVASARPQIELLLFEADGVADYAEAFAAMAKQNAGALVIGNDPQFYADRELLARMALEARLPTICEWATMARAGCMIGYGAIQSELRRSMARQVAAILAGASPGEMPLEQPAAFEFAVNQRTAKALGLTLPPSILLRATEVIE